jgi:hypothetical protein
MITKTQIDEMVIDVDQDLEIEAPIRTVYESMIHRLTAGNTGANDEPLPMELERRPGGRWYRNLGEGRGHLWGLVQSIREPDLLEISGPLFMSYPVSNHIIIRFEETDRGTRLRFRHRALGLIEEGHRDLTEGWKHMLAAVAEHATG